MIFTAPDNLQTDAMPHRDIINMDNGRFPIEGDWDDEEDEDFDDRLDAVVDIGEEDDDHLPDDDLQ